VELTKETGVVALGLTVKVALEFPVVFTADVAVALSAKAWNVVKYPVGVAGESKGLGNNRSEGVGVRFSSPPPKFLPFVLEGP